MANTKRVIAINGGISPWHNSAAYVKHELEALGDGPIDVMVSSLGGDVNEALQIKAAFEQHGDVTVHYIGFNASSATLIGHGAVKTTIRNDAMCLIHKPTVWVDAWGDMDADKMEKTIQEMQNQKKDAETCTLLIAQDYVNCRGMQLDKVLNLMKDARWIMAEDAKVLGLVDEIISSKEVTPVNDQLFANCKALGYPAPERKQEPNEPPIVTNEINEAPSWFASAFSKLMNNHQKKEMKKEYQFLNAALSVEGVDEKEGAITLTAEQCVVLNNLLKTNNEALTAANSAKTTAETVVQTLSNQLDAVHTSAKAATTITDKITAIQNVLDNRPGAPAITPAANHVDDMYKGVAVDPINNFINE